MTVGRITSGGTTVLPELVQRVLVDGVHRPDVYCTSTNHSGGTGGSTAQLEFPAMVWDGGKPALRGKTVEVFVGYGVASSCVFCGWVTDVTGDAASQAVTATATSLLGLADAVYLGQQSGDRSQEFTYRNARLRDVVRDCVRLLPSQYRSVLSLGVLTAELDEVPVGELTFRQASFRDALEQCLALVGNVGVREEFRAGARVVLHLYELHNEGAAVRRIVVARPGESAANSNVLQISDSDSLDGVRSRIIAFGDLSKTMLTATSDALTPEHRLRRLWRPTLEAAALKNPELKSEIDGQRVLTYEGQGDVFRRYALPVALAGRTILKENALTVSDGTTESALPVQVWKEYPALVEQEDGSWAATGGLVREMLDSVELHLDEGWLQLKEPCVYLAASTVGDVAVVVDPPDELPPEEEPEAPEDPEPPEEEPVTETKFRVVDTWLEARLCITLTVAGARLRVDTGSQPDGFTLSRINGDGLTETVTNESFQRIDLGGGLADPGLAGFGCMWHLPGTGWQGVAEPTPLVDDSAVLQQFARGALRERNRVRTAYAIRTPYWIDAVRLGDRVEIIGQDDYRYGVHQIQSLSHDLTHDHGTALSTDTVVPLVTSELLGGG